MIIEHDGASYEVVDHIPPRYEVWNIGRHAPPGYIPLCRLTQFQRFPGGRDIETDKLKAIPIDLAEKFLPADVVEKYRRNCKEDEPC